MNWNRFDICEAWYVFAMLHHRGQWSQEYEIFGRLNRMEFRPAPTLSGPRDLEDNGREIYEALVGQYVEGEVV